MSKFKRIIIIFTIVLIGFLIRILGVSSTPPGLTWDEVSLGYNAYSILTTGRDEYGEILPLTLKSFGDYKPALYSYLIIPFIFFFGLNELAVRLPSVVFGTASILLVFLLVRELFKSDIKGYLASLMYALSPWAMIFSRPAFEANLSVFMNLLGFYLLVRWINSRNLTLLLISLIVFCFSIFTYQASRLFVPIIIFTTVLISGRYKRLATKEMGLFGGMFLILIATFFTLIILGQTDRLASVNYFAYTRLEEKTQIILNEDNLKNDFYFTFFHGQWFEYIRGLFERYLMYFSPKTLLIDGDYAERHSTPDIGVLNLYSLIFLPLGLYWLIKKENRYSQNLILLWLLVSPLPAVLSRDLFTTLRGINMSIPWAILEGLGLYFIVFNGLRYLWLKYLIRVLAGLAIVVSVGVFLDSYFIHLPKEHSKFWLYGYKQVFEKTEELNFDKYRQVVISDDYGQPYIYYLFYSKYSPLKFQNQAKLIQQGVDVGTVKKIDNIEFRHIYWPSDRSSEKSLFIGTLEELPDKDIQGNEKFKVLKDVYFLNGEHALRIVKTI